MSWRTALIGSKGRRPIDVALTRIRRSYSTGGSVDVIKSLDLTRIMRGYRATPSLMTILLTKWRVPFVVMLCICRRCHNGFVVVT